MKQKIEKNISRIVKDEVLKHIVQFGSFTIPDIVENTGISATTIAKYVNELQEDRILIVQDTIKTERRGRRPILYGMRPDANYFVGVDINMSSLTLGLMDISGKMLRISNDDSFRFANSYNKFEDICMSVEKFIQESGCEISSICFSIGGRVNTVKGTCASHFNFEEHGDTPLADVLSQCFGCKVFIENDTKAITYGEYMSLKDNSIQNFLYVNIGWGLGLGVIIDGKQLTGANGYAGEFGHMPFYDNDVICHCGKKGCIETEASGSAINRKLVQHIMNGEQSMLSERVLKGNQLTIQEILYAAEKEDPLCIDLISQTGTELGRHLAGMISLFNPDTIMIGGTLSKAAAYYFLHPLSASVRKYSLKLLSRDVSIMTSKLGDNAGIIGACFVARSRVFMDIISGQGSALF